VATIIATRMGGYTVTQAVNRVATQGSKSLSPFTIPLFLANLAAAHISIKYGFKGIIGAPGAAFAASLQATGDGYNSILNQDAVIAVVGGSDACINPVTLGEFNAAKALTTPFNDSPAKASRPFDSSRSGVAMSEDAGLLVLEELAHATSTIIGDNAELAALRTVFSTHKPYISSTKSSTGHLLGASGVTGASFSIKALNENILPPSLNIDNLDEKAEG
jgi:3-oxoacyl-[acyl-carrier-protein] synthase II